MRIYIPIKKSKNPSFGISLTTKLIAVLLISSKASARSVPHVPDSIAGKRYDYFIERLDSDTNSAVMDAFYTRCYITNALSEKNWPQVVLAYKSLLFKSDKSIRLVYADSMISAANKTKDKSIEAHAHITKGAVYYNLNRYGEALEQYLIANKLVTTTKNQYYTYQLKYLIGQVKCYLGYYDEAVSLLRECVGYYQKEGGKPYLSSLYCLGICYQKAGNLDLCSATNSLGIRDARETDDLDLIPYFEYSEGANQYLKGNYKTSIEKLTKAAPLIVKKGDMANESVLNFYLAKNYVALGQMKNAIPYLLKVDEAFTNDVFVKPDLREAYELLIKYYKEKGDTQNQLLYINRLIEADKYILANFKYLSGKLRKEYNTEKLLAAKADIEELLEREMMLHIALVVLSVLVLSMLAIVILRKYRKRRLRRRKMANFKKRSEKIKAVEIGPGDLEINPDIVAALRKHFENFEVSKKYLDKDLSVKKLAEMFNSNTSYVSKVVNHYKGCKVMEYIYGLKVDHVIMLLQNEKKYRSYTNKALAAEVGFGSVGLFVKVFERKAGMNVLEFVEAINDGEKG